MSRSTITRLRATLQPLIDRVTLPQLILVLTVADRPGLSVNDLAEATGLSQPAASRTLAILLGRYETEKGIPMEYIEQRINADDPRKRAIFLAPAGAALVEEIAKSHEVD